MPAHSDYYDAHAEEFVMDTQTVDMSELYEPFLQLIPAGGRILDAGCGSGRDTRAFLAKGYDVVAMDASAKMVEAATVFTGRTVLQKPFEEINWVEEFDGIWTCASLLHVRKTEMGEVWSKLTKALKPGGVWFMSFKNGTGEAVRNGRFFNDYDEDSLRTLIQQQPQLRLVKLWTTQDARKGREGDEWTNAVVRRAAWRDAAARGSRKTIE